MESKCRTGRSAPHRSWRLSVASREEEPTKNEEQHGTEDVRRRSRIRFGCLTSLKTSACAAMRRVSRWGCHEQRSSLRNALAAKKLGALRHTAGGCVRMQNGSGVTSHD